jgi:cytoskeletal protein CcmA (bactofilin family)
LYGGTGHTNYSKGDLLVGAGGTFVKLATSTDNYVLYSNTSLPSGVGWTWVTAVGIGTTAPTITHNADLWWNSTDGSLNVYYSDGDTDQWVEIAGGSGIDLSQPVHITSTVGSTSVSTGALIVDGGVGIQGELHAASLVINGTYDVVGTSVTLATTAANQVIFTLDSAVYRSVKFMVQISRGSDFQVQEILLLHDAIDTYLTQYAQLLSGNNLVLATYDADLNSGNIRLLVTPTFANTTFKIYGTAVRD